MNGQNNGYPPGQFPGGGYQQQYAQQQFQQPMQPQFPQGFQPTQAPGPTHMHAPQAQGGGGFHIPDQATIQASYQRAQELKAKIAQAQGGGGFSKLRFFELLGPNGQKWSTAFTGFTAARAIYIMPAWREGLMNYHERIRHFWKSASKPQGASINGGAEDCLITKAYRLALDRGVKSPWMRPQKLYVYQGFPYEYDLATGSIQVDVSQCIHEDGAIRPMLLEAVSTIHTAIQDIAVVRQFVEMFHPDFGRPLLIKKTKTGPESKNVDYSILDLAQQPLADAFRPGLNHLYALDEIFKPASPEEQIQAIIDSGLPVPPAAGGFHGQAQTGYAPPQQQFQQPQIPQGMPQMQYQQAPAQSYQQLPQAPAPSPYAPQQYQQQSWPPPAGAQVGSGQFQQQPQFAGQMQAPKPLPPPPQGVGGIAAGTPMIQQGVMMPPQGGFQQPPMQPQYQQPQGQGPLTPEDLQAQLQGGGNGAPF